jgi:hypothetical protein
MAAVAVAVVVVVRRAAERWGLPTAAAEMADMAM